MKGTSHAQVKPFYNPPQLLVKQAVAIMLYAWLTGWNKRAFLRWSIQLQNLIHAGAGARQICCLNSIFSTFLYTLFFGDINSRAPSFFPPQNMKIL
ncbi:MAG TPA: hypothetical protein VMW67_00645 [Desulfobacteria bacterium]|nr:hypothetical protein [Desulfobacteria bacterium]